jgi:uncharacterized protein YciI
MPFLIIARDKPGSVGRRTELRPAHLEYLTGHTARLLAAGAMLGEDGATPCGSLILFDTEDRAEAEAFAAGDPFSAGGLFAEVEIRPWRKVFFGGERLI